MPVLPSSGVISIDDIATEFSCERDLLACATAARLPLTDISMESFYGLSSFPVGTLKQSLFSPSSGTNAFGQSVVTTDKYLIISECYWNNKTGRVLIYDVNTRNLIRTINNPAVSTADSNGGEFDQFGFKVAAAGELMIVSAPWAKYSSSSFTKATGYVYIFNLATGQLLRSHYDGGGGNHYDYGEGTVAAGPDLVVASADRTNIARAIHIFNSSGTLLSSPISEDYGFQESFGYSLAVYGNTVLTSSNNGASCIVQLSSTGGHIRTFSNYSKWFRVTGDKLIAGIAGSTTVNVYNLVTNSVELQILRPSSNLSDPRVMAANDKYVVIGYLDGSIGGTDHTIKRHSVYVFDIVTGAHLVTYADPLHYGPSNSQLSTKPPTFVEYRHQGEHVALTESSLLVGNGWCGTDSTNPEGIVYEFV